MLKRRGYRPALNGFESPLDYRGSPLSMLKMDAALWKGGEREPAAVRAAAANVGAAAAAVSAAAEAAARQRAGVAAGYMARGRIDMSPKLAKALLGWSESLHKAGRELASLMALQAVVMGIMSVHRRNVLAGYEEAVLLSMDGAAVDVGAAGVGAASGGAPAGKAGGRDFVYGNLARLEREILAATGVAHALLAGANRAFGGAYENACEVAGISSVLRGVPWLSVTRRGDLIWCPPAVVAAILDADVDDPTAWMAGIGRPQEAQPQEEEGRNERLPPLARPSHPCLQQFEAYFDHRDAADFAAALYRAGFFGSAALVVSRIIASAAVPESMGMLSADWQMVLQPPALRGGGSPPPTSVLEAETRERHGVRSQPALIYRFEELAGFRVAGRWASLRPIGVGLTFDAVAKGTPGLLESGPGGRRITKKTGWQPPPSAEEQTVNATSPQTQTRTPRLPSSLPPSSKSVLRLDGRKGARPRPRHPSLNAVAEELDKEEEAAAAAATARVTLNGAVRPRPVTGDAVARHSTLRQAATSAGRFSVELDSKPSVAFAPCFEAARFVTDLLIYQGVVERHRHTKNGRGSAGDGEGEAESGEVPRHRTPPALARGVKVHGGAALLVVAALKQVQDRRRAGDVNHTRDGDSVALHDIYVELKGLCGLSFGSEKVLESLRTAAGIVERGEDRYSWEFDANVVRDAIRVSETGDGCELEVDEFRGFLTRCSTGDK